MIITILERDEVAGTATIHFEHSGVAFTDSYDLATIIPGTRAALEKAGETFTPEKQQAAIDRLVLMITTFIDDGAIRNPPPMPEEPEPRPDFYPFEREGMPE